MESYIYEASTIEECIQLACEDLNLSSQEINYEIIDKKSFFKKKSRIKVFLAEKKDIEVNNFPKNGIVLVKDGMIKVTNPQDGGKKAQLIPGKNIQLYVDGEEMVSPVYVDESNKIEYKLIEEDSKRIFKIVTRENGMEAYGNVEFSPKRIYKLSDCSASDVVELKAEIVEEVSPPIFNEQEIRQGLEQAGIKFGILDSGIREVIKNVGAGEVLLARGIEVENSVDDRMMIYFKDTTVRKYDDREKVDFRNWSNIKMVKKGELLAELILGKEGQDGTDVFGNRLPHKKYKPMKVLAAEGCFLQGNKVYSTIEGKPYCRGNSIGVNRSYVLNSDVDMSTGNLDFVGDIKISGNISVGMSVKSGSDIYIEGSADRANIEARHNIVIIGNALNSVIEAGKEDVLKKLEIDILNSLKEQLVKLIQTVGEVQNHQLLGKNRSDGEVIKVLIENKFKLINTYALEMIEKFSDSNGNDKLNSAIKEYLLGVGPLSIKDYTILNDIIKLIDDKLLTITDDIECDREIFLSYCQECKIHSSGNVYFTGKGEYLSEIISNKGIYLNKDKCIARGGLLRAETEIRCKEVGSTGGVKTKLMVGKQGHIYVDIAYHNTLFAVGAREYLLEEPSKNIHVYLDRQGDIVVDKFRL